jgi:subtilisin-like proprotein convertase family protein
LQLTRRPVSSQRLVAAALPGNSALSTFNGQNLNGIWQLFVMDDSGGHSGVLSGWMLQITAEADI